MLKINRKILVMLLLACLLLTLFVWHSTPSIQAAPVQPLTLHSQKPLVPIHMDGPTLQPIHMHSLAGIVPINPPTPHTLWHELYPQYCEQWYHTSWEDMNHNDILDTGDQIDMTNAATEEVRWYHVDRVTFTMFVTPMEPGYEPMYIEFKGPYDEGILYQPVCTLWHEVYPLYSNVYHILDWTDNGNGFLDFCDYIMLEDTNTGLLSWWHVEEVATDLILNEKIMDPIGIMWHELYPTYCKNHSLTSWEESPEDLYPGRLSPGDQIDMTSDAEYWDIFWSMGDVNRDGYINMTDANRIAAKFGWTGPPGGIPEDINSDGAVDGTDVYICGLNYGKNIWAYFPDLGKTEWYYVDRVTLTLLVSNYSNPEQIMYIEYKGPFETMYDVKTDPIETLWHEVYPEYCPVFQIIDWEDNCNGVLSYCDYLTLFDLETQAITLWHVEGLSIDIILNEKITDPTCTYWNELHPQFGNIYHIIDWEDDGDMLLSPHDDVYLDPGPTTPYTVTDVTLTLFVSLMDNPEQTMYIEFTGGFQHLYEPKTNPIGTWWHEVYPEYCPEFQIMDWIDNCNGVLSYCDKITLMDMSGFPTLWHVEELAIDITVQEIVHDVSVTSVTPLFTSVFQGYPNPITVVVSNDGDFTETFNVDVKYGGIHVTTSPITVNNLPPKTSKQLTFCWVTKNVPLGIYTITAYANPVPYETDLADNSLTDGTVTILAPPPFYWKEGFCDYAPSGVPDFDQKQWGTYNWTDNFGAWSHCGPVAVANSLWWLDSKFEPAQPPVLPPAISDGFPLVSAYLPGIDDHDPANVQPLIEHLAYLMDTQGPAGVGLRTGLAHSGTYVNDMEAGLAQYLSWTGVNPKGDVNGDGIVNNTDVWIVGNASGSIPGAPKWNMAADIFPITLGWPGIADNKVDMNDALLVSANLGKTGFFYERTVNKPDYYFIEEEVEKSEDVVLLIGYWYYNPEAPPGYRWYREGGHYLTIAGVNSTELKIAVSDPCLDAFENGLILEGRVPIPHAHMPPEPPYITHNDAAYVSHDIYNVALISQFPGIDPNPNGTWTLVNYAGWKPTPPYFAVIESAVITSPLGIHDVAVTNVTSPKTVICQGYSGNITVKAENQGNFTETFNLALYANTTTIETKEVTLTSGNSTTVTFTWNTTGFAKGNYTIWAYAWPVQGETHTADNTFTDSWIIVSMVGDITGPNGWPDGKCDMRDIRMVAKAFGAILVTDPASPKYGEYWHSTPCSSCPHSPNCDINNDGKIDMKDIRAVAKQFGKIDP